MLICKRASGRDRFLALGRFGRKLNSNLRSLRWALMKFDEVGFCLETTKHAKPCTPSTQQSNQQSQSGMPGEARSPRRCGRCCGSALPALRSFQPFLFIAPAPAVLLFLSFFLFFFHREPHQKCFDRRSLTNLTPVTLYLLFSEHSISCDDLSSKPPSIQLHLVPY